jgi:hypothetical protein
MKASSVVAAILFIIVAVLQGIRYFNGWPVVINGTDVPLWVSLCGTIVPALMAIWLLCDCKNACKPKEINSNNVTH